MLNALKAANNDSFSSLLKLFQSSMKSHSLLSMIFLKFSLAIPNFADIFDICPTKYFSTVELAISSCITASILIRSIEIFCAVDSVTLMQARLTWFSNIISKKYF